MGFAPYMAAGCSTERLEDARRFFGEPGRAAPGTDTQLARVGDMVDDCVRLRAREGASVAGYLPN